MAISFEDNTGNKMEILDELHRLWSDIYATVGLRQGMSTEAMRFAATLRQATRPNRPLGAEDAAQILAAQSQDGSASAVETTKWIGNVTKAVDRLWEDRTSAACCHCPLPSAGSQTV